MQLPNFPITQEHVKKLYSSGKLCVSDLSTADRNYLIKTIAANSDYAKLITLVEKSLTSTNVIHAVLASLIFGNDDKGTLIPYNKKIIELLELNISENLKKDIQDLFDSCSMDDKFEKMVKLHNATISHQKKNSNS
jgi:transcriptional regulator with PAS, ATPase and Fis domain